MKVRTIAKSKAQSNLGRKCKSFEWLCVICEHYKYFDVHGKFPTDTELDAWAEPFRQEYLAHDTTVFHPWKDPQTRFGRRNK